MYILCRPPVKVMSVCLGHIKSKFVEKEVKKGGGRVRTVPYQSHPEMEGGIHRSLQG